MLARVLEPEVMDTAEEAADYDAMDHGDVNRGFCDDLLRQPDVDVARTLDLGTGTALIAIELCRRAPGAHVVAVDLAEQMLALARANVRAAGLDARIRLERRDAKATGLDAASFSTVMTNSLVHHVPDPLPLFVELRRLVAPGGWVFVRDLVRPADESALRALIDRYAPPSAAGETGAAARDARQRALFDASLRAALSEADVRAFAQSAGMAGARVWLSSDRHFTLAYRAP